MQMNVLIIKQTSLGDVLHASGHVRRLRLHYPDAHLTLVTSVDAAELFRHNPHIDELIEFDRYRIKRQWARHPIACARHVLDTLIKVRCREYDLAIDLQGRWKTVLFLWGARAKRRVVKGRWWFAERFHQPELHALQELDGVLAVAGLPAHESHMEVHLSKEECRRVDDILVSCGVVRPRFVVFCPVSRWPTKDWPLEYYRDLCNTLPTDCAVVVTGTNAIRERITTELKVPDGRLLVNLAGKLSLLELAELVGRAGAVVCGDSFPMHLASSRGAPVIALFGPTDERRVGPVDTVGTVIRPDNDCHRCYRRRHCSQQCMVHISVDKVAAAVAHVLAPT